MMLYLLHFIFPTLFVLPVNLRIKVKFSPEQLSSTAPPKPNYMENTFYFFISISVKDFVHLLDPLLLNHFIL